MEYENYINWLLEIHPDCQYIKNHGADDGILLAYENNYLWDDFVEFLAYYKKC